MPHWLARERAGQEAAPFKRFSAPFWTVDFPRPMMAAVTTTAPDVLRVDAVFYGSGDLAGLIWESVDRWDHPLLGYETRRDYAHCRLSFRWRSGGVKALDAVQGPTLTIEGRDADGAPRSWYVRLWNYATGTPTDARVTLDFDALDGGFLLPGEADRVWPHDIDRLFISVIPAAYDAGTTPFAAGVEAWVEMSDIRADGSGSVIPIGDAVVPEHGLSIATGYDDAYNQAPERVLRQILALGYRGAINHYAGMSHYFRLARGAHGVLLVGLTGGALNVACAAWHRDFAARAKALGFELILSLSYELFDAHCPEAWKQCAVDGSPALTGWVPPSTLLSPAQGEAMAYLRAVALALVAIAGTAGLAVRFQVGEPWWWIMADGRPCLYDEAARAALGGSPPVIASVRGSLSNDETALLDAAGGLLAASTAALCAAVKAAVPEAETLLLVYLPTVLDADAPEVRRANVPVGWAAPAFDRLQVEDYDWVTEGRVALSRAGRAAITARLGYARDEQQYLAGFVLTGGEEAAGQWDRIAEAAAVSRASGDAATFIWALPQVARDGFTWFEPSGEQSMQHFDDVRFPLAIGRRAQVSPGFSTQMVETVSGREQRSADWADARMRFDAGLGIRSEADLVSLIAFFRARRGAARGFRFTDPYDYHSADWGEMASAIDQRIGVGDGAQTAFPLVKHYGTDIDDPQERRITRPVADSVRVAIDGVEQGTGWMLEPLGLVLFDVPPAEGAVVTAGFAFDVPVRFEEDSLDVSAETFAAGQVASVPLVEIRE